VQKRVPSAAAAAEPPVNRCAATATAAAVTAAVLPRLRPSVVAYDIICTAWV
jgi:hypothetical protein